MVALSVTKTAVDRSSTSAGRDALRAVRLWLGFLILLVFAMVLVGGATRLTESGLSITEWNLIAGTLPPLSEAAWREAFDLYRQSPQYALLNRGMSIDAFRTIYWWEWGHRELGRFIGLVYVAGYLWFGFRRSISLRTFVALTAIGLLLGTQGLVGWIMVASGLQPGMTAVAPVKLMLHLTLASLFFASLVAAYVRLGGAAPEAAGGGPRRAAHALVGLVLGQIALGGLVAGHDAGLTYNTWPLMDGRFVPAGLTMLEPLWLNIVDNIATIQFNHRMGAYVLAAGVLAYAVWVWGETATVRGRAILLSALVIAEFALGIATLVYVVPVGLAITHQGLAMVLLFALVWNAAVMRSGGISPARSDRDGLPLSRRE